eukprot:8014841-Karenia_brevis.AAC.1
MPLDFSLWDKIDKRMAETAPEGKKTESKEEFVARLERTARSLPRAVVRAAIARLPKNIQAIIDADGWHPRND